jgi:hypothetical protein
MIIVIHGENRGIQMIDILRYSSQQCGFTRAAASTNADDKWLVQWFHQTKINIAVH